jgi:hypothetical protein
VKKIKFRNYLVSDGKKEKDDARDKEIQRLNLELCKIKTGSCSYNVVDFDAYVQLISCVLKFN